MEVAQFEEIQSAFMDRIQEAVYCNVATVDSKGRPRSRVMHLVWDGPVGWVISARESHKAKHLANNAHVSLAYIHSPYQPVYIDCVAVWETDLHEKRRIWDLHKNTPAPLGFDPTAYYGEQAYENSGLLRFDPWRVELATLDGENLIWRPRAGQTRRNG